MGDEEKTKKKTNPREDLDRYIDEIKRKGETLNDENLHRLIFSPGGSAERREEEADAYEEDFSDALEFIREDTKYSSKLKDEEEIFQDARSHFDPSVSSPHPNMSPSRGSIDPLSPSTSFALDKMSRVSLCSPPAAPHGYLPSNGQGISSPSHPSSIRPSLPPRLHPSLNHPTPPPPVPNGSYHTNGTPVPYPPTMAPTPYIPQSMPLPPTVIPKGSVPPRNGHAMTTTSSVNPLFNPYAPTPTSMSYPIHPHAPPYPPVPYPAPTRIPPQKIAEKQCEQAELARFLAQHEQMTTRMISQCSKQMHFPPHHIHPHLHHSLRPMQQVQQHPRGMPPPCAPSTSGMPPHSSRISSSNLVEWFLPSNIPIHISPELYVLAFEYEHSASEIFRPGYEQAKEIVKEKGRRRSSGEKELIVIIRHHPHLTAPLPRGLTPQEYKKARKEYKRGKTLLKKEKKEKEKMKKEESEEENEATPRPPRPRKKKELNKEKGNDEISMGEHLHGMNEEELEKVMEKRKKDILKAKILSKFGTYVEDAEGNILPPEEGGRLITFEGDPRFPLPQGKDMSFYIRPSDAPPSPRSLCPSPSAISLEYVDEVPPCTEGRNKPLLCRGHYQTRERRENPDLFGGKYLQKIQALFHSVSGDPTRVPNASTKGDQWENPLKEGEEPIGMEVYRNVRGRVWNPHFDYSPVLQQLMDEEQLHNKIPLKVKEKTKNERIRKDNDEKIPVRGNVFSCYSGEGVETDSDLSDSSGDGRIAVGREELKREEEMRKEKEKELADKEKEKSERRRVLVRDGNMKVHNGYYPLMMAERYWGRISYYEKETQVGDPYMCKWNIPKVYVDPQIHENTDSKPERYALAAFDRVGRDEKTTKVLLQQDQTFYFKTSPGGYLILGSHSEPPMFVQSPLYNAMMGEQLDTIIRITKGHEMIIFDENFFNLLLQQAYQHGERVVYEMKQLLLTRVSCTKGWGEAYQKETILDTLVWVEINLLNPIKKIDTLLRGVSEIPTTTWTSSRRGSDNCDDKNDPQSSEQNNASDAS